MSSAFEAAKSAALTMVQTFTEAANENARKVKAFENIAATLNEIIETSDDPQVVKFREYRDQLNATLLDATTKIEGHVRASLPAADNVDVAAETEAYKTNREQVKAFTNALRAIPGVSEEELSKLPALESLGRMTGGAGKGAGTAKPRLDKIIVWDADKDRSTATEVYSEVKQEDGTKVRKYTLTRLGQVLKVDGALLREHAEAEGGKAETWKDRDGKPFTFAVAVGEGDTAKNVMVEVTPRA